MVTAEIDKQSNLKRGNPAWVKGMKSPHPSGREPNELCMPPTYRQLVTGKPNKVIAKWLKDGKGELTGVQQMAIGMFKKAKSGDVQAAREITDRIDGKVKDTTDITTNGQSINLKPVFVVADQATKEAAERIESEPCVN